MTPNITIDKTTRATYIQLTDNDIALTRDVKGIYIDFDCNGEIIGIEILKDFKVEIIDD